MNSFSYDSFIYVKEGLSKTLIREDDETPCLLSNLESEQKKKKKRIRLIKQIWLVTGQPWKNSNSSLVIRILY